MKTFSLALFSIFTRCLLTRAKIAYMAFTWIAIIASLLMGIGALLIFIFAVKQDYFRDLEDAKYQVFWSDLEELVESSKAELHTFSEEDRSNGNGQESPRNRT